MGIRIKYQEINFSQGSLTLIQQANTIIEEYSAAGYDLTLRQLYYQLVSRDIIRNKQTEYKRLGSIVGDARLCGLMDWDVIVDRTRNLEQLAHWEDPESILDSVAQQFRIEKWATQPTYVEVWIEKEALAGVFERICTELDVPYFACRGYTSLSEMWSAGQRFRAVTRGRHGAATEPRDVVILHFGDHDPSGIDMTRDIRDRLRLFARTDRLDIRRIALNMAQVEEWNPPPNPAKATDARFAGYQQEFGDESWELDALDPLTLATLVRNEVGSLRDATAWEEAEAIELEHKGRLEAISERYEDVIHWMQEQDADDTDIE